MKTASREHREAEFAELDRRAHELLFKPHLLCRPPLVGIGHPRFIVWHFPAFGDYRSWSVCISRRRHSQVAQQLAREVTCRRLSDIQRFTDPLTGLAKGFNTWPSVEVRDGFVNKEEVETRFKELTRIVIPVLPPERVIGADGQTFGLASELDGIRFEWWCDGPKSWKPLTSWTSNTLNWLAEVCSNSTAESPQPHVEVKTGPLPLP